MPWLICMAVSALLSADSGSTDTSAHQANPVYRDLMEHGWTVEGKKIALVGPKLGDGLSKSEQQRVLAEIAGSERAVPDFLRPSVTAPHVLRLHDDKTESGDVIRGGSLWFVVHTDLDQIDPADISRKSSDSRPVEAGNMRFETTLLEPAALEKRSIKPANAGRESREWFVHLTGRLLGRIHVEDTDRVTASRSDESWIVAARTDGRFDRDPEFGNHWSPLDQTAGGKAEPKPFAGGASYVKITRLAASPGALLVESDFAFLEPRPWFDGAPILRSKISLVAQDRIRGLRRDLAKSRKGSEDRKNTEPAPTSGGASPIAK